MYLLNDYYSAVTENELERRRSAAQKILADKGVDCLLLVGFSFSQGAAIRYFTDWVCWNTGVYAVLPQKGKISVWGSGAEGSPCMPPYIARGLGETHSYPFWPSLGFTADYVPTVLAEFIRDNNFKTVGIYRKAVVSYTIMDKLRELGCEFVELDNEIDMLQAVKSEEELASFREIATLHDTLYAALRCFVRPGRKEWEIASDIKKCATDLGCEELNIMIGAGNPIGKHKPSFMQNHMVNKGDAMDLLVEVQGPGGLFGEVSRMWSMGKPSDDLRRAFDDCIEIQEHLASIAKPGLPASEIMRELHRFQDAHGYDREKRLFAHSQGYDVVMRPCCMLNETMELRENMLLAIHPCLGNSSVFSMITDNFLITPEGGKMMSNTPREIYVVDC